jgi:ABC-type sugar transport system substrate-binding protein
MEDDSVLCVDCVHEATGDGMPLGARSLVHAWIGAGPGVCCIWCSDGDDLGGWAA